MFLSRRTTLIHASVTHLQTISFAFLFLSLHRHWALWWMDCPVVSVCLFCEGSFTCHHFTLLSGRRNLIHLSGHSDPWQLFDKQICCIKLYKTDFSFSRSKCWVIPVHKLTYGGKMLTLTSVHFCSGKSPLQPVPPGVCFVCKNVMMLIFIVCQSEQVRGVWWP